MHNAILGLVAMQYVMCDAARAMVATHVQWWANCKSFVCPPLPACCLAFEVSPIMDWMRWESYG